MKLAVVRIFISKNFDLVFQRSGIKYLPTISGSVVSKHEKCLNRGTEEPQRQIRVKENGIVRKREMGDTKKVKE